ncbi:RidA family protein [Runella sp.]|uniref:RidA family protein n=1 Tax=Runella sp. TaxID=1960881 RepID=UPI003D15075D
MKKLFLWLPVLLISGALFAQTKTTINPKELPPVSNYSQVVIINEGKTAFISGQVSVNSKGEIIGKGDLKAQAKQVFENLKTVLAASGANFSNLVKLTFYVRSKQENALRIIREVRDEYIPAQQPPASTLLFVEGLYSPDILIEIEAVAALK